MERQLNDVITNYGVTLRRLTQDKIELVRRWRNDPKISQYMEYREEITPDMQEKWFHKINNDKNLYYIIYYGGEDIGLINVKDIQDRSGEGGIFIWNDRYLNSDISYRAHLALFDYLFINKIIDSITSHVLKDNPRAQRFTKYLGFRLSENQEVIYNQLYTLNRNDYLNNLNRIRYVKRFNKLENE